MKNYPVIYDGKVAKFRRNLAITDIFTLAQSSTNTGGASVIAQGVVNSSKDVYITSFMVGASSNGAIGYVTIGTSTVLPFTTTGTSGGPLIITGNRDAPLAIATAGSTITVIGTSTCGYTLHMSGVQEPVYAKIETEA